VHSVLLLIDAIQFRVHLAKSVYYSTTISTSCSAHLNERHIPGNATTRHYYDLRHFIKF